MKRILSMLMVLALAAFASVSVTAKPAGTADEKSAAKSARVEVPLNLAILVQDDLVSRVGTELDVTREFIRSLPAGSRVMVAYVSSGSLRVRQQFTGDLEAAAKSLRVPFASEAASPFNPYIGVRDALRKFEATKGENRNALLLISDGLDISRGFGFSDSLNSHDLLRAIDEAKRRDVAVFTFYAPTVGLTSYNRTAVSFGQSALTRLADATGGRAFFQGTDYVSFTPYFNRLRETLNERYTKAY